LKTTDALRAMLGLSIGGLYVAGAAYFVFRSWTAGLSFLEFLTSVGRWGGVIEGAAGWFFPAMLGAVFAGYAVIIGATVAGSDPETEKNARDTMAWSCGAVAGFCVVFTILISVWTIQMPQNLPQLAPIAAVTVLVVGLSSKVGSFYVGDPATQIASISAQVTANEKLRDKIESRFRSAWPNGTPTRRKALLALIIGAAIATVVGLVSTAIVLLLTGYHFVWSGWGPIAGATSLIAIWEVSWTALAARQSLTRAPRAYAIVMAVIYSVVGLGGLALLVAAVPEGDSVRDALAKQSLITDVTSSAITAILLATLPFARWLQSRAWFTISVAVGILSLRTISWQDAALRLRLGAAQQRKCQWDDRVSRGKN
jgi:hypothetical protein